MSVFLETPYGAIRRVQPGVYLLQLPCGHDERLDERQYRGQLSVDHSMTGCPSGYHETHDFASAAIEALPSH